MAFWLAVFVFVLWYESTVSGPQGWTSRADSAHTLTSWPKAPAGVGPTPLGLPQAEAPDADTYAFEVTQKGSEDPVRYDPCAPIHYVVNDRKAFDGADDELAAAIAEVEEATGLVFVDDGETEEAPVGSRAYREPYYGESWSPVLVAWSDKRELGQLKDTFGFSRSKSIANDGHTWFVTGSVALNGPQLADLYQEEDGPAQVRAQIMHELGHLVGLADVTAPGEIMTPAKRVDAASWGPGDLAGLSQLGGTGPCIAY